MVSLLVLALGCSESDRQAPDEGEVALDCSEACADLRTRQAAVAAACGLPAEVADRDCSATNVVRLECQVSCVESAECDLLDGTNTAYSSVTFRDYVSCLDECPGPDPG